MWYAAVFVPFLLVGWFRSGEIWMSVVRIVTYTLITSCCVTSVGVGVSVVSVLSVMWACVELSLSAMAIKDLLRGRRGDRAVYAWVVGPLAWAEELDDAPSSKYRSGAMDDSVLRYIVEADGHAAEGYAFVSVAKCSSVEWFVVTGSVAFGTLVGLFGTDHFGALFELHDATSPGFVG